MGLRKKLIFCLQGTKNPYWRKIALARKKNTHKVFCDVVVSWCLMEPEISSWKKRKSPYSWEMTNFYEAGRISSAWMERGGEYKFREGGMYSAGSGLRQQAWHKGSNHWLWSLIVLWDYDSFNFKFQLCHLLTL